MSERVRRVMFAKALGVLVLGSVVGISAQSGQGGGQTGQPAAQGGRGQQQVRRDARETAPEGLIGTWVMNVEKSRYNPGPGVKSQLRQFDYTHDGMLLCHWIQENQQGVKNSGHWIVTLDGREYPEYFRRLGSIVALVVTLKKVDEYRMDFTVIRHGRLTNDGYWQISPDGNTLTQGHPIAHSRRRG